MKSKNRHKNTAVKNQVQNKSQDIDDYIKIRCLSILDELLKHPISQIFSEPVNPVEDEAPNYFDIIKNPMDFSTIRKKLQECQYSSVHDFKQDVQLIFSNAIKYNGRSSQIGSMAIELQTIFKNLTKTLSDDPNLAWYNELLQLKKQLLDHVHSAAKFNPAAFPSLQKQIPTVPVKDSGCHVTKFESRVMREKELTTLASNLQQIKEKGQIEMVIKVIQKFNPEVDISNGSTINLHLLTPGALREIQEIVSNFDINSEY